MSERSTEVLKEALSLSAVERAEIIERLLSSLDGPGRHELDRLWAEEVEDRLDAFDRGEIDSVPAKQVFDEIASKIE